MFAIPAVDLCKQVELSGGLEQVRDFRQLGNFVSYRGDHVRFYRYADHGRLIPPQIMWLHNCHHLQFAAIVELLDAAAYCPLGYAKFCGYLRKGHPSIILEERYDGSINIV